MRSGTKSARGAWWLAVVMTAGSALAQAPPQATEPLPPRRPITLQTPAPATPSAAGPVIISPTAQPLAESDVRPVTFHGIVLGSATPDSVQRVWGAPSRTVRESSALRNTYAVAPFERVEVTFAGGKAVTMTIHLRQVFEPEVLSQQLQLLGCEPVDVTDEQGHPVGLSYPERGVALALAPGIAGRQVNRIVLDCIDAEPFLLRAEARQYINLSGCLEDIKQALKIEPRHPYGMWLKCVALDRAGRTNESLEACVAGLAAHPDSMALNIVQARLLAQSDRYPDALRSIEQALARSSQQPELRPEALVVLADLVANGPKHDYPLALDYRLQAIQSAEPFSKDPRVAFQRVAHDATLDAHLGAASDIAHGNWKNKPETVTRWLERSRQLAGAGVSADHAARDRLKTCRKALEICKVLKGQIDPQPWVDSYTQEVRQLLASLRDPLSRTRLAWEAGMTMGDAMHALQSRGEREAALRAGGVAIGYLEEAVPKTAISPRESAALSSAYFRLGSIYAISDQDHKQASAWYDKAWEPLQRASSQQGPEQLNQGEMLVSMAVSYWAVGQQQRAEEAARRGVELIEGAVADGLAERRDLAIPYANLASIHRHLGREESARNYADLAARIKDGVKR